MKREKSQNLVLAIPIKLPIGKKKKKNRRQKERLVHDDARARALFSTSSYVPLLSLRRSGRTSATVCIKSKSKVQKEVV